MQITKEVGCIWERFSKFSRNQDLLIKLIGKCSNVCCFLCFLKRREFSTYTSSDQFHRWIIPEGDFLFTVNWTKQMWAVHSLGSCCLGYEASRLKSTRGRLTKVFYVCIKSPLETANAIVGNLATVCWLFLGSVSREQWCLLLSISTH